MAVGIDYSMGTANVDVDTGIHYGVIPVGEVLQAWADSSEADYGEPHCPTCGELVLSVPSDDEDWDGEGDMGCCVCVPKRLWWSEECYPEQPLSFSYDADGYKAVQGGDDTDIFVLCSPYYTLAEFCSPCAPGAGYLLSPDEDGVKAYCFGHDWFEDEVAPYPVYLVSDDTLVEGKGSDREQQHIS